jgi:hypothetical protein
MCLFFIGHPHPSYMTYSTTCISLLMWMKSDDKHPPTKQIMDVKDAGDV